jgi:hypothetical protein
MYNPVKAKFDHNNSETVGGKYEKTYAELYIPVKAESDHRSFDLLTSKGLR